MGHQTYFKIDCFCKIIYFEIADMFFSETLYILSLTVSAGPTAPHIFALSIPITRSKIYLLSIFDKDEH